jgi:formate-dependent nitrite reductase membrane component NrfD
MTSTGTDPVRTYYGRPVVKRPVWKWFIPAYLFTGGVAAGSVLLAAGARLTGRHRLARRCLLSASAATAVSGGFLVADLGKPERFVNMLRVAKVTSPMSVGTWVLSAFGTATAAATAGDLLGIAQPVGLAAEVVAAALAPVMATYTAVLVADTAIPAWHDARHELPFVFGGGAAAGAGALAVLLNHDAEPARRLAIGGAVVELAATKALEHRLGETGEAYRRGKAGVLNKVAAACTAGGVAALVLGARRRPAQVAGSLLLLTGAAAERFAVFHAGIESAEDPVFTVGPQRRRLARNSRRQGAPPRTPHRSDAAG